MPTAASSSGRSRRRIVTVFLGFCCSFISLAEAAAQRREHVVDAWRPLHYDVIIALDDRLSAINRATTQIQARILKNDVQSIDLDFGELKVDSVKVDDQPARSERKPDRLDISLAQPAKAGEQVNITVTYHGRPKDGLILATDRDGKPSATGDNWPDRVHQWIPCLDHPSAKATVTFTITAPSRDSVVANGRFENAAKNSEGTTTWKFEEAKPIPPYCMVIAVSEGMKLDASEPTVTP